MTVLKFADKNGCGCSLADVSGKLLTIDQALDAIGSLVAAVLEKQVLNLALAKGRVLADPVVATAMAPPFDNSAMDGYAVRIRDMTGDGPWTLPLQDRLPAGDNRALALLPGHAIQIFTGAKMPAGAEAVVIQEVAVADHRRVTFSARPKPGQHIRRVGDDMRTGDVALAAGQTLDARDIAAAAATGAATVAVRRDIRVAILVTGEELQSAGAALRNAQIWDVNTPLLATAIAEPGVEIIAISHAGDNQRDLARELGRLSRISDLVVTTGGVSVGEEDHMPAAVEQAGGRIEFAGVAMKPGKPVSAGRVGQALWLGLPGNPVSAFVAWTLFGTHMLGCLTGTTRKRPARRHVITEKQIDHKPGRCEMRPATLIGFDALGREVASFGQATHSARVRTLALADGLVMIPAEAEALPKGSLVEFIPFRDV
jgi:molybdopterin molybdotransferase